MSNPGRFMKKTFSNQKLEIYVGDEADWYSYADNESMSYVLIVGIFKDYDEECGVITLYTDTGHTIYLSESEVGMFWLADQGFNLLEATTSTIRSGKRMLKKKRDIM